MAKQSAIEQDGVIVEALSNAMFRVELSKCLLTTYRKEELYLDINKIRYESKSIIKETYARM